MSLYGNENLDWNYTKYIVNFVPTVFKEDPSKHNFKVHYLSINNLISSKIAKNFLEVSECKLNIILIIRIEKII